MCVQDWRLGRMVRTQRVAFDIEGPATYTLPQDNQRVGWEVNFNIDSTTAAQWSTISWDSGGSLLIPVYKPFFRCDLTTHGDLPTKAVTFAGLVGVLSGYLFVWTMPEEYLSAALEEFRRQYDPLRR